MQIQNLFSNLVEALSPIYELGEAKSIARIVFEDAFQIYDLTSTKDFPEQFMSRYARIKGQLLQAEPVQYVLGQADFYGLKFKVDNRVLIPRQETEELVYWILELFDATTSLRILDIGTGSGCIPIVLKRKRPQWEVHAWDVSAGALSIAQENGERQQLTIHWKQVDILEEQQWGDQLDFDLIVSNPPYIPFKEVVHMPRHVTAYEPGLALFVPDATPLIFYKKIGHFSRNSLNSNGLLFFEVNEFQAEELAAYFQTQGWIVELRVDMNGKQRMMCAKLAANGITS